MNRQQRRAQAGDVPAKPQMPIRPVAAIPTLFDHARRHHQAGRLAEAERLYTQILAADPRHAEAHSNLGGVFQNLRRFDDALAACNMAISLKPDDADFHFNRAITLQALGRFREAMAAYSQVIRLNPGFAEAHSNLGNLFRGLGRFDAAFTAYKRAIHLNPFYAEAHSNLGALLEILGRFDDALTACNTAIAIKSGYPEAHATQGAVLEKLGRLEESITAFKTAIRLSPDDPELHFGLSAPYLKAGLLREGWEKFEWRWQTRQMAGAARHFETPVWNGEAGAKTLLIHAEQGFGDSLQFCRYAPLAAERGLRVVLEVQKPLVKLLRGLLGIDQVIAHGDALPPFDVHAPMMSLPRIFGTTIETIPGQTPYLHADENAAASWRQRLSGIAGQTPKIGLLWAGNPRTHSPELTAIDRRRSIPPDLFAPLFKIPDLQFFSLQKDGPGPSFDFPLINFMPEIVDFADTAALIANLDLVISVDTAVAHLAAALGKPVWLLNRFDSCWRWLTGRRDSPWYPTLRLYTQPQPGAWNPVIAEIAGALSQFQQTRHGPA